MPKGNETTNGLPAADPKEEASQSHFEQQIRANAHGAILSSRRLAA
jgi:hypothetical protein